MPGSRRCTWTSTSPGRTSSPVASTVGTPSTARFSPTAMIRPSRTATSCRRRPSCETTVPPVKPRAGVALSDMEVPVDQWSAKLQGQAGVLFVDLPDGAELEEIADVQFQPARGDGLDVLGGVLVGDGDDLLLLVAVEDQFVAGLAGVERRFGIELEVLPVLVDGDVGGQLRVGQHVLPALDLGLEERLDLVPVLVDVLLGGDVRLTDQREPGVREQHRGDVEPLVPQIDRLGVDEPEVAVDLALRYADRVALHRNGLDA